MRHINRLVDKVLQVSYERTFLQGWNWHEANYYFDLTEGTATVEVSVEQLFSLILIEFPPGPTSFRFVITSKLLIGLNMKPLERTWAFHPLFRCAR